MFPYKKQDPNELLHQALPLSDEEDDDNECYQYLRGVRNEATIIDQQLEERKEDEEMEHEPLVPPIKVVPTKSKGTGIVNLDQKWKNDTMTHYTEMQASLHIRRNELKEYYPETLYQWTDDIQTIIFKQPEEGEEQKTNESALKSPDIDEIARCSEGFLHYCIRNLLDLYEDEWRTNNNIPFQMHLWIWSFLIMMQKPLLPDVAADLNDLLWVYEGIKEHHAAQSESAEPSYTMYDSIIFIITEHFEQRFQY